MTDKISLELDTSALAQNMGEAGAEIARIAREEIAPAAALIEDAFSAVARAIERDLARAARSGSLSLQSLAKGIAGDLRRSLVDALVRKPVEAALLGAFGGARAQGGFVAPGASYLVGERGPERFTPSVSGRIAPASAPVAVTIALSGAADADSFRRSEAQIAAALARALARAGRNL